MFQNCSRRPKLRVKSVKDPMFSGQKSTCSGQPLPRTQEENCLPPDTKCSAHLTYWRFQKVFRRGLGEDPGRQGLRGWAELTVRGSFPANR